MKAFVFCLMSVVLAISSFAQAPQPATPRSPFLNRQRPGAAAPAANRAANATGPGAVNPAAAPGAETEAGGRSIEFNAAPLDMVFTVYQDLVGKTVLKDPQVNAQPITLQPKKGQELSVEDKIEAIETVLEMNGVHLEPYGEKFVRAIPRKTARNEGIPLYLDEVALERAVESGYVTDGKTVSLMIRFKHLNDEDMQNVAQKVLESLKSASGVTLVLSRSRRILVTDTYLNIKRMLEIVPEIDVKQPEDPLPEIECIPIRNGKAANIVTVIERIVTDSMKEQEAQQKKAGAQSAPAPTIQTRPLLGGLRRPGQGQRPEELASTPSLVINASDADHGIIRGRVTVIAEDESNKIVLITSAENMRVFKRIIEALDVKNIDTDVKIFRLKYADAEEVSSMINDLIGNSASSKDSKGGSSTKQQGASANLTRNTQTASQRPANQRQGPVSAGELNKENTTVLYDKRINGLVVMTQKELFPIVEKIIESMDIKLSQVLIETAIVEVTLGDDLDTGVNWARLGDRGQGTKVVGQRQVPLTDDWGRRLYWKDGSRTETTWDQSQVGEGGGAAWKFENVYDTVRSGFLNTEGKFVSALGGGGASETASGLINAFGGVTNLVVSPAGSGLNWFFKSDSLNLSAIIQASKTDSRSKYIASPVVMTLDNKEAVINATEMSYLLKGFTSSGNSYSTIAVPDYEQKELGIEIKVTPKINPNGTVMLSVESKYTQIGADQKIKYSAGSGEKAHLEEVGVPTTITREMQSDVLLENMQSVVFGGLTQSFKKTTETGIPILKDIPIIGKWLFGSVSEKEKRTELLVFMTPYVLDDAQAAQAEALRRKKTMSDPRPWEDGGWSLSELADPVSEKDQMRRIKEEWKKQDEERQTKIAIEKMKVERAKKLKEMSKEERELWLKMHKEELDEEAQDELEEKMLDKESQEELKKLAAEVRAKKLAEADVEIKKMEEMTAAENERGKLEAEKKAKAAEKPEETK